MKNLDGEIMEGIVKKSNENTFIPFDDANIDYQEYLKWLAEGNTPEVLGE